MSLLDDVQAAMAAMPRRGCPPHLVPPEFLGPTWERVPLAAHATIVTCLNDCGQVFVFRRVDDDAEGEAMFLRPIKPGRP